jgi:hypothetical protein
MNENKLSQILKDHELWLEGKGGKCANFCDIDLNCFGFKQVNFSYANFKNVNLHKADLRAAIFYGAKFNNVNFNGADLSGSDFRNVNISKSEFNNAKFRGANLYGVNFSGLELKYANFYSASLYEAVFCGADLHGSYFFYADITGANFCRSNISFVDFERAELSKNIRATGAPHRRAMRTDGYEFFLWHTDAGWRVMAGCRFFTMDEAWQHWEKTRGNTPIGDESLDILTMFELHIQRAEKK